MIRLDKFLCEMGIGSRTQVKQLIKSGQVRINDTVCREAERKVEERKDRVSCQGRELSYAKYAYYMLHKPAGCVTAVSDRKEKTVMELLEGAAERELFPVGRLDKDTEGLLLITNDGALAHRLLSPGKHVEKTYLVSLARPMSEEERKRLEEGVDIGEKKRTLPARAVFTDGTHTALWLTITEGKFHQVKRMCQAVGNEVVYLKRLSMGSLRLDETLEKGAYRRLTEQEAAALLEEA